MLISYLSETEILIKKKKKISTHSGQVTYSNVIIREFSVSPVKLSLLEFYLFTQSMHIDCVYKKCSNKVLKNFFFVET